MPIAFGAMLAPVGSLICGLLLLLAVFFLDAPGNAGVFAYLLLSYGFLIGALLAAPSTMIVLPLARYILRNHASSNASALSGVGFVSGALTMGGIVWMLLRRDQSFLSLGPLVFTFAGGVSGAICGALYASLIRKFSHAQHSSSDSENA